MLFDTKYCTGCGTCEMACSYHHRKMFCPGISSIEIIGKPEELGFGIFVFKETEKGHLACDGCQGLDVPLCVKYCNAIARDELRGIISHFKGVNTG